MGSHVALAQDEAMGTAASLEKRLYLLTSADLLFRSLIWNVLLCLHLVNFYSSHKLSSNLVNCRDTTQVYKGQKPYRKYYPLNFTYETPKLLY